MLRRLGRTSEHSPHSRPTRQASSPAPISAAEVAGRGRRGGAGAEAVQHRWSLGGVALVALDWSEGRPSDLRDGRDGKDFQAVSFWDAFTLQWDVDIGDVVGHHESLADPFRPQSLTTICIGVSSRLSTRKHFEACPAWKRRLFLCGGMRSHDH